MTAHHPDEAERRHSFRIDDQVYLRWRTVPDTNSQPAAQWLPGGEALSLFAEFRRLDQEAAGLLGAIAPGQRALADYLQLLNRKLDLLAGLVSEQQRESLGEPVPVSLSEDGLSWVSEQAIAVGSQLALQLVFPPGFSGVITFARATRCDPVSGGHQVAVVFDQLSDAQRQVIARHIMQCQLAERRQQRQ